MFFYRFVTRKATSQMNLKVPSFEIMYTTSMGHILFTAISDEDPLSHSKKDKNKSLVG